jgi:hypothetical protein
VRPGRAGPWSPRRGRPFGMPVAAMIARGAGGDCSAANGSQRGDGERGVTMPARTSPRRDVIGTGNALLPPAPMTPPAGSGAVRAPSMPRRSASKRRTHHARPL